jgi:hypothetical protein
MTDVAGRFIIPLHGAVHSAVHDDVQGKFFGIMVKEISEDKGWLDKNINFT